MRISTFLLLACSLFLVTNLSAQTGSVGIGTSRPNADAVLDVSSNSKALVVPRLTEAAINSLSPKAGMVVYNLDRQSFQVGKGAASTPVSSFLSATSGLPLDAPTVGEQTYLAPSSFTVDEIGFTLISGTAPFTIFTLNVYAGTGTGGALLGSATLQLPASSSSLYYFKLAGSTVNFTAGQTYTFVVSTNNSTGNFIAVNNNVYSGGFLTHNGTVSPFDLSFEVRSVSAGSWAALAEASDITFTAFLANGPNTYASNVAFRLTRSNKMVTLTLPADLINLTVNGVNDIVLAFLPADYRPATNTYIPIRVQNGGTAAIGLAYVLTDGRVFFKPNATGGFWNGANSGLYAFSISYVTP